MTLEETIARCEDQIRLQGGDRPLVGFILPGKWGKKGHRKLVDVPGAPYGEIVSELPLWRIVVMFDAKEVLSWAKKMIEEADATF